MRDRILKKLSVLVSFALVMSLFATSIVAQAQTTTSTDADSQTTVETSGDNTDPTGAEETGENHPDCREIKKRIEDLESKIRANANTATEDEIARLKKELEDHREKLKKCAEDHDVTREEIRDRLEDRPCEDLKKRISELEDKIENSTGATDDEIANLKAELEDHKKKFANCAELQDKTPEEIRDAIKDEMTDRPCEDIRRKIKELADKIAANADSTDEAIAKLREELEEHKKKLAACAEANDIDKDEVRDRVEDEVKDRLENVADNCKECLELRMKLREAKEKGHEMWENLSRARAALQKIKEEMAANPDDAELKAKYEDIKTKAERAHTAWKDLHEKMMAAKAALENCVEKIKDRCADLMPKIRDNIRGDDDSDIVRDRAAAAILVQWGNVTEPQKGQERSEWEIDAKIDDGKVRVRKEVLFEDNDETVEGDSENAIRVNSRIAGHWDGVLLQVMPGAKASEFVIHVGDFHKVYRAKELYGLHEKHELDNGMEVVINSTVRGLEVAKDKYEEITDRQEKVSGKLYNLDSKLRELGDNDKFNEKARKRYNKFREEVEDYLVPEGGEKDFEDFLAKCEERMAESADEEDVIDCEERLETLRKRQRADKFNEGLIPFPDVDDNEWFVEFVRYAKENKIVSGFKDGSFGPGKNATRAELLKMAMEASGEDLDEEGDDNPEDSRDHWAKKYIAKGLKKKIVSGFEDGKEFRPNEPVTRAQAVKIIFNALGIQAPDCEDGDFEDTKGHWAKCLINHAKELGIVGGNPDGSFAPDQPITRAAIAKIIKNAIEYARAQEGGSDDEVTPEEMKEIEDEIFGDDSESEDDDTSEDDSSDDSSDDDSSDDSNDDSSADDSDDTSAS